MHHTRAIARILAVAITLVAFASNAHAVGGTAPPLECGKTLVFARAMPGSPVATAGTDLEIGGLIFFELTGPCPPGPYSLNATIVVDCPPLGPLSDTVNMAINPGFTPVSFSIPVPPTGLTDCIVSGAAVVTFADGTAIRTQLPPTDYCLAAPVPFGAGPRLQIEHLAPRIDLAHPGDQSEFILQVTNMDPAETFNGTFVATSRQRGRLPNEVGLPEPPNSGRYANSGPIIGENFPIALPMHLAPGGCVILPPNPHGGGVPALIENVALDPGQTMQFDVSGRSWPLTARGNMSQIDVRLDGTYTSGDPGSACISVVAAADSQQNPDYQCADAGAVTTLTPGMAANLFFDGQPAPGDAVLVEAQLVNTSVNVVSNPPVATDIAADARALTPDHGRIQTNITRTGGGALFSATSMFDVTFDYAISDASGDPGVVAEVTRIETVLNAPFGFATQYPYAIGRIEITRKDGLSSPIHYIDFFYQVQIQGGNANDGRINFEILDLNVELVPGGFRATLRATDMNAARGGSPPPIICLEGTGDMRGTTGGGYGGTYCPGDFNADLTIDFDDLNILLGNWGATVPPKTNGDADGDSDVDFDDLNILLGAWGSTC